MSADTAQPPDEPHGELSANWTAPRHRIDAWHRTGCADGTHRPDMPLGDDTDHSHRERAIHADLAGRESQFRRGPAAMASERRDAADSSHPDPDLLLFCTNIAN